MVFPNPDFIHDENSNQHLFFKKFIKMLNRNYIALSTAEHEKMLDFVSDCCEAFYQYVQSTQKIEGHSNNIINSLEAEIEELTAQAA
jgi:hypothetical protein